MATLALPLVAGAIGAEIGIGATAAGFLISGAAAVGSYIDNKYVIPGLLGVPEAKTSSPRKVGDINIQADYEGAQANYAYGRAVRTSGAVIWQNDTLIREGITYYSHMAIHVARMRTAEIPKVWAGSKLIYDATLREITFDVHLFQPSNSIIPGGTSYHTGATQFQPWIDYLSHLKVGKSINITGHADNSLDGDYPVAHAADGALIVTGIPLGIAPTAPGLPLQSMTFFQEEAAYDGRYDAIRFYYGDQTQLPDPLLVSLEGGTYPAHRGSTYVVIEKLKLTDWGNRQPNTIDFLVVEKDDRKIGETIGLILDRANLSADKYDVSALNTQIDPGYLDSGVTSPIASLRPLLLRYNLTVQEEAGKLYFFKKESSSMVDIDIRQFGAGSPGETIVEPFELSLLTDLDQPDEVSVAYMDPVKDYLRGEKSDKRRTASLNRVQTVDLQNITMSGTQARDVATRELYKIPAEVDSVQFSLPPSELRLQEGDVVRTVFNNDLYTIRIVQLDVGANFLITGQGLVEDRDTFTGQDSVTEVPSTTGATIPTLPNLTLHLLDLAPLRSGDEGDPGIYLAVAATDPNDTFFGAQIYESLDNTNFNLRTGSTAEFAMGKTLSALAAATTDVGFEYGYTVDVELIQGTITSVTESDIINNGLNRWLIGNEIVYVVNATLIAPHQYRLEGFLRGARDTLDEAAGHAVDERVVSLDPNLINFLSLSLADLGGTKYYKALSIGVPVNSGTSQSKVVGLHTLRPFSPGTVVGTYTPNDDLTVTWLRRSRTFVGLFPPANLPLIDGPPEKYDIEVLDGLGGNVVRTETVTSATTWFYDKQDQIGDGVGAGPPKYLRIYQVTSFYGRGKPAVVTLT